MAERFNDWQGDDKTFCIRPLKEALDIECTEAKIIKTVRLGKRNVDEDENVRVCRPLLVEFDSRLTKKSGNGKPVRT